MTTIGSRLKHAWNAFVNQDPLQPFRAYQGSAYGYGQRPDRPRTLYAGERTIISSIYTRLSIDVASVDIRHVRLNEEDQYVEDIDSGLNNCLKLEANIDQAARAFRQDVAKALFSTGTAAIVPVDTTIDPSISSGFDVKTLRVGEIVTWFPRHVRVSVYNDQKGRREEIILEKRFVAIVENPLYDVMNEPNSTLQRLIRKLSLLDTVDEASSSGKLDIIIQLPYAIKSEARRADAERRRTDMEFQLKGSKYGIAYADSTEKVTQLNRPAENNLLAQIQLLTDQLYSQLGLTPDVMNGTANEQTMLNYNNRTVEPILAAIAEAMKRTFLTKTARAQRQSVEYFRSPFKLVPIGDIAEIADKFTRNEIMSSNEIRAVIGIKPSKDPKASELRNSNMPQPDDAVASEDSTAAAQGAISSVNQMLDDLDRELAGVK